MNNLADYSSRNIKIAKGDGCYVYDDKGKKYVDFIAGWCVGNIGWGNKEVQEAISVAAESGVYVPPLFRFHKWEEFAKLLVDISPNNKLSRVFRCTSGSEAVEFALKCARASTGKRKIVSVDGVYHGHTYGAASVGDACVPGMQPCLPDLIKIPMPDPYRRPDFRQILKELENILKSGDVAAFLSEPVWTNAGSIIPPKEFYPAIEKLCRKYGALFIMDEVATGFGRCGRLFASELWGVKPDILCLAKGMTGGYGTMGATLVTEKIFKAGKSIPFYSTFGWNVFDLAATKANVEVILKNKLWKNSEKIGAYLLEKLKPLEQLPYVGEVRGIGLLLGIEIIRDKKTKIPDWNQAQKIQDACAAAGLLIETAGHALFITPPLILDKKTADEGVEILNGIIKS
jgi:4-aminobutyrate aminotransferase-like enzyme